MLATLFYFFKLLLLIHSSALKTPVLLFENDIMTARRRAALLAYLPNKKILFLLVFILLIFAGWFYFSDYKNGQAEYIAEKEKGPLVVALEQTSQLDKDTDGDGLKDWEELLWKTDPNKADTDGDGTSDNEEITLNRNPLKAGSSDKISDKEDIVAQEKAVADSKQNTMTAIYARKFMSDYLTLKTQKGELTEEDKQNLVVKTMEGIKPPDMVDKYKISDLNISKDILEESIKEYALGMKSVFIDTKMPTMSELDIFTVLLKSIKEENFKNIEISEKALNEYIVLNKELAKIILLPDVPENLSKNHLEVVNGFNNLAFSVENMAVAETDPVRAMVGQRLYTEQKLRIYNAMKNIEEIFNKYEITVFK